MFYLSTARQMEVTNVTIIECGKVYVVPFCLARLDVARIILPPGKRMGLKVGGPYIV